MNMWYITAPICISAIGVFLLLFGIWGIVYWDQYGKLSSNIKLWIDKTIYNWKQKGR